jgi:hypothetical protein
MIIWLAGYPRSGNNLLRAMLQHSLEVPSYPERASWAYKQDALESLLGSLHSDLSWPRFYAGASSAPGAHVIKTHDWPRDEADAICLVRNPRITLGSYFRFHRKNGILKQPDGLLRLVLGDDYYGSWSGYYRAWRSRRGRTLFLRHEDLTERPEEALSEVAAFLGHQGARHPWKEQLERLRRSSRTDTSFLRSGPQAWERPPEWDENIEAVFREVHGEWAEVLGYKEERQPAAVVPQPWVRIAADLAEAAQHWRIQSVFKEEVIQALG